MFPKEATSHIQGGGGGQGGPFPVMLGDLLEAYTTGGPFGDLHAAFVNESRTLGRCLVPRIGNPGSLDKRAKCARPRPGNENAAVRPSQIFGGFTMDLLYWESQSRLHPVRGKGLSHLKESMSIEH